MEAGFKGRQEPRSSPRAATRGNSCSGKLTTILMLLLCAKAAHKARSRLTSTVWRVFLADSAARPLADRTIEVPLYNVWKQQEKTTSKQLPLRLSDNQLKLGKCPGKYRQRIPDMTIQQSPHMPAPAITAAYEVWGKPTIPTKQAQISSPSQWAKVASDLNSMVPGRLPGPTKTNTLIESEPVSYSTIDQVEKMIMRLHLHETFR